MTRKNDFGFVYVCMDASLVRGDESVLEAVMCMSVSVSVRVTKLLVSLQGLPGPAGPVGEAGKAGDRVSSF